TERLIRSLLATGRSRLPTASAIADRTPMAQTTPESYLGYGRLERYAGGSVVHDRESSYSFPRSLPQDDLAYAGRWRVEAQQVVAGAGARLRLRFRAHDVYLVLGGHGTVRALVDGRPAGTTRVNGDRLYT